MAWKASTRPKEFADRLDSLGLFASEARLEEPIVRELDEASSPVLEPLSLWQAASVKQQKPLPRKRAGNKVWLPLDMSDLHLRSDSTAGGAALSVSVADTILNESQTTTCCDLPDEPDQLESMTRPTSTDTDSKSVDKSLLPFPPLQLTSISYLTKNKTSPSIMAQTSDAGAQLNSEEWDPELSQRVEEFPNLGFKPELLEPTPTRIQLRTIKAMNLSTENMASPSRQQTPFRKPELPSHGLQMSVSPMSREAQEEKLAALGVQKRQDVPSLQPVLPSTTAPLRFDPRSQPFQMSSSSFEPQNIGRSPHSSNTSSMVHLGTHAGNQYQPHYPNAMPYSSYQKANEVNLRINKDPPHYHSVANPTSTGAGFKQEVLSNTQRTNAATDTDIQSFFTFSEQRFRYQQLLLKQQQYPKSVNHPNTPITSGTGDFNFRFPGPSDTVGTPPVSASHNNMLRSLHEVARSGASRANTIARTVMYDPIACFEGPLAQPTTPSPTFNGTPITAPQDFHTPACQGHIEHVSISKAAGTSDPLPWKDRPVNIRTILRSDVSNDHPGAASREAPGLTATAYGRTWMEGLETRSSNLSPLLSPGIIAPPSPFIDSAASSPPNNQQSLRDATFWFSHDPRVPMTDKHITSIQKSHTLTFPRSPGLEPITDLTTSILAPVYTNLNEYLSDEKTSQRYYFRRWERAPDWCVDNSVVGLQSFFGEDWGVPPPRLGRDPRYRPVRLGW